MAAFSTAPYNPRQHQVMTIWEAAREGALMKESTVKQDLSRRSFIGGAALGLSALAVGGLAGCAPKATAADGEEPGGASGNAAGVQWDGEYDVIVCGGGGSGLTAAYSALENGAEKVLVLEKGTMCGGTTALAEGAVQASGTTWQKEIAGVTDDSPELHKQFWMTDAEGLVKEDLVACMADNAADNLQWMADSFGITFSNVFGCYPTPYMKDEYLRDRIHLITDAADETKTGGAVWTTNAQKAVEEKGGQIETKTEVTDIYQDDSGTVVGVACADGKNYQAKKGVVLAMASIDHNEDMAFKYNQQHYWDLKTQAVATAATDTGDGIRIGMAHGADSAFHGAVDLILQTWSYTNNQNPEIPYILVDQRGNRFVREDTTYAFHCRAMFNAAMAQGGMDGATYMLMDSKMTSSDAKCAWSDNAEGGAKAREAALADGSMVQADTIDELAAALGMDAGNLQATVNAWNAACAAGTDAAYGRTVQLTALDAAPFYAWKTQNTNIGSIGGLLINTDAAILDTEGEPIPHLFGAGVNTAGWIGPYYPGSGTCLQGALNWGRIAGKSAAAVA